MDNKEKQREWVKQNPERNAATKKRWRVKPGSQKLMRKLHKEYYEANKLDQLSKSSKRKTRNKLICIDYYSNGTNKCAECDISDMDMLTLDHINNNGAAHRKAIGGNKGSDRLYRHLIETNFLEEMQVLCWNHNLKKEIVRRRKESLTHKFSKCGSATEGV